METLPGGTLPETPSPSSAPDSIPAGNQAAPAPSPAPSRAPSEAAGRRTARPTPRSEPALTRARAASVPPRRQTRSGTASVAALFKQRTLHNLRSFALYTNVETQDIAHHLENASLFTEYAYVSTTLTGNHSGGGDKLKVPNTFKEPMSLPQATRWKAAADKEIPSLKKHGVYELVPASSVPAGQKVVGSRWVKKIKADDRFKSRLVVLGWAHVPGIDCGGTFAPVCRLQSIRMMLAIAAELDYEVLMLDVQTAFLKADVEEKVYVKMAPGCETYDKSGVPFVMKLKKSLYGLRQSPMNWFGTMDGHLSNIGLRSLKSDLCVCVFEEKTGTAILTLYVDDILLLGNNKQLLGKLKKQLMDHFEMTDLGDVSKVLGMNVLFSRSRVTIKPLLLYGSMARLSYIITLFNYVLHCFCLFVW